MKRRALTVSARSAEHTPSSHEEDDGDLLARVARGDISPMGRLYERHAGTVLGFVLRATRRAHDAEDVVQETFLTAARAAASYRGPGSCRAWLLGIAARHLQHRRRALIRLTTFLNRVAEERGAGATPHDETLRRLEASRIERALGELTEAKRMVLLMAEVEGMTCEEIATALGIPVGTVWTRLHHARRELRGILGEEGS